jgi:hypothetical protein
MNNRLRASVGTLRTKDRCRIAEFFSVHRAAKLVIELSVYWRWRRVRACPAQ